MFKLTWRDILAHPKRFAFTVIAVVLGVGFLVGTLALRDQLQESLDTAATVGVVGDLHVSGKPLSELSNSRSQVPNGLAARVAEVPGVDKARANQSAPVTVLGKDDLPIVTAGLITVVNNVADFNPWQLRGQAPSGEGEVVVEKDALARLGGSEGGELKFVIHGQTVTAKVVGTLEYPKTMGGINVIGMDTEALAAHLPNPQVADEIAVQVTADADVSQVAEDIRAQVGGGYDVLTSEEVSQQARSDLRTALGFVTAFILVFNALALGVSIFIIANTFTMVVKARQKEFAYLRAIGVSPFQVFTAIAGQAAIIGVLGSVLGIAAGAGLLALATWGLQRLSLVTSVSASISTPIMLLALVVGTAVTIVGALLPGRRAAQIPPVEAMREVSGVREYPLWGRLAVGVVLLAAGAAALVTSINLDSDYAGWVLGGGALATVVGTLVAAPALAVGMLKIIAWPLTKVRSAWMRLGVGNSLRNPRRTAATGGALIIGMGLVSAGLVLADSLRVSTQSMVENELTADLMVAPLAPGETIPDSLYDTIKTLPGVGEVTSIELAPSSVKLPDKEQPVPMFIVSADFTDLTKSLKLHMRAGQLSDGAEDGVVIHSSTADDYDLKIGDSLEIPTAEGVQTLQIKAIHDYTVLQATLISPASAQTHHIVPLGRMRMLINATDGTDVEQLRDQIRTHLPPGGTIAAMNKDDLVTFSAQMINRVLAVVYALVGLSVLVAALGIVNTLGLSILERIREIALVRVVGLSRLKVGASIAVESVLTALFGAVAGIAVGVGVATALVYYLREDGLSQLSIPTSALAMTLLVTALGAVVASLLPGWQAGRVPVLQAVTQE